MQIIRPFPDNVDLTMSASDIPRGGDIIFSSDNAGPILIIKPDGSLVRGDGFRTDDEASVAFFDCIAAYMPTAISELRQRAENAERKLAELIAGNQA